MTKCPHCGKEFLIGSSYCPYCDKEISSRRRKFAGVNIDLLNLEKIPLKNFIVPDLIGLGSIAVIAILFVCII